MITRNDARRMAEKIKTARVAITKASLDVDAVRFGDESDDHAFEDASEFLAQALTAIRAAEDSISIVEVQ